MQCYIGIHWPGHESLHRKSGLFHRCPGACRGGPPVRPYCSPPRRQVVLWPSGPPPLISWSSFFLQHVLGLSVAGRRNTRWISRSFRTSSAGKSSVV